MSSITTSGLKSFTLASVLAIATTLGFSAVANADSWAQGPTPQWKAVSGGTIPAGECWIRVGAVRDFYAEHDAVKWALIGGAQVWCEHYHSIHVTVREAYKPLGSTYYSWVGKQGVSSSWTQGFWTDHILQTSRNCGYGYWFTQADVYIDGVAAVPVQNSPQLVNGLMGACG